MFRKWLLIHLLLLPVMVIAQQNSDFRITGSIPDVNDPNLYQVQVGAFQQSSNAERAYAMLENVSLNPVYEQHNGLTRVLVAGIRAGEVPAVLEKIKNAGFNEAAIRVETTSRRDMDTPAITARQPPTRMEIQITINTNVRPAVQSVRYED
jgi:hypothetical protein